MIQQNSHEITGEEAGFPEVQETFISRGLRKDKNFGETVLAHRGHIDSYDRQLWIFIDLKLQNRILELEIFADAQLTVLIDSGGIVEFYPNQRKGSIELKHNFEAMWGKLSMQRWITMKTCRE